jgi:hypothetical protein
MSAVVGVAGATQAGQGRLWRGAGQASATGTVLLARGKVVTRIWACHGVETISIDFELVLLVQEV